MDLNDFRGPEDPEPIAPDEWLWERIRIWRDAELTATDWTQLPDTPVATEPWALYRQALRDITEFATPADVVFPVRPGS
jgi:hypothetical protein